MKPRTIRRVESTVEKNSKLSFGKVTKVERNKIMAAKENIERNPMSLRCSLFKCSDFLTKENKRIMIGENKININNPIE